MGKWLIDKQFFRVYLDMEYIGFGFEINIEKLDGKWSPEFSIQLGPFEILISKGY